MTYRLSGEIIDIFYGSVFFMKNRKFIAVLAVLFFAVCTGSFAASSKVGIGVQGGYVATSNGYGHAALTFKIPKVPPVFAVNAGIWGGQLHRLGATADFWLGNPNITGALNFFYGPGLAVGATFNTNQPFGVYVGGRFVVGLNAYIVDFLEVYVQAAAQLGIDTTNSNIFDWGIPLNAGIRFWF